MLGNGRLLAEDLGDSGKKRLCHIRGKLRKKVWINAGDIILLSSFFIFFAKLKLIVSITLGNYFYISS